MRKFTAPTFILLLVALVGTASAQQIMPRLNKAIELLENGQRIYYCFLFVLRFDKRRLIVDR